MTLFDCITSDMYVSLVWEMLEKMYPHIYVWFQNGNHYELKRDFNTWARRIYAMHRAYANDQTKRGNNTYDLTQRLWVQWVTDLDNAMYADGINDSLVSPVTDLSLWRFDETASDVLLKSRWHRFETLDLI